MNQLTLDLELTPVMNEAKIFWCCPHCLHRSNGLHSLNWQPPDYKVGKCEYCKREFVFSSTHGEDELIAAGGIVI